MLTGHIQLMPLSRRLNTCPPHLYSKLPHYAILCSIINSPGRVLFSGIGFFFFPNISPLFRSSLSCHRGGWNCGKDLYSNLILSSFDHWLQCDFSFFFFFLFVRAFLSEERFIPHKIISQLSHKSKRLYYTFGEITLRRQMILHLPFPRLENKTLRDW